MTEEDLVSLFIRFENPGGQKIVFRLMRGKMKGQAFVMFDSKYRSAIFNHLYQSIKSRQPNVGPDIPPIFRAIPPCKINKNSAVRWNDNQMYLQKARNPLWISIGKKIDRWMAVFAQIWKWSRLTPHSWQCSGSRLCARSQDENGVSCVLILTLNLVGFTQIYLWSCIYDARLIALMGF